MSKSVQIPDTTVRRLKEQMLAEQRSLKLAIRAGREWVRDRASYASLTRLSRLATDLEAGAEVCDCELADVIAVLVEPDNEPDDVSRFWMDVSGEEFPDRVFVDGFLTGAMDAWTQVRRRMAELN